MFTYDRNGRIRDLNKREKEAWEKEVAERKVLWDAIELLCKKGEKEIAYALRITYDSLYRDWG